MARRHSTFRPRAPRRQTLWFFIGPTETTLAASSTATLVFSLNAAALAFRPFTIVRTHLEVSLRSDQAGAIEEQHVGLGLAVVTDQAVGIGVTAVPTPVTDMGSDAWFFHHLLNADESNLTDRTRSGQFRSWDSKAMRKVEDGFDIVTVLEGQGFGGGMVVGIGGRLLIKVN